MYTDNPLFSADADRGFVFLPDAFIFWCIDMKSKGLESNTIPEHHNTKEDTICHLFFHFWVSFYRLSF